MKNKLIPDISFEDLYIEERFELLKQNNFYNYLQDESQDYTDNSYKDKDTFEVFANKLKTEKDLVDKNFLEDTLLQSISNISDFYDYLIKKKIKEKGIYGKQAKLDFYYEQDNYLLEIVDRLQESKHLSSQIIKLSVEQAYLCKDLLNNRINEVTEVYETIPFTLSKVDLLHLFSALYEAKVISQNISPSQLFFRMEKYFVYEKDKKLKNLYNTFQEYKSGRKNSRKSIERLGELLCKIFPF